MFLVPGDTEDPITVMHKTMLSFHKNRDCPTSQELLAYQNGRAPKKTLRKLYEHICSCDFCGAEAEFYSHFPNSADDGITIADIPEHLFELAEAILNNKQNGNSLLNRLIKENESFVF